MASITKWFKRAKSALLNGDMRTWEGVREMIGNDLRRQLEEEFGLNGGQQKSAPAAPAPQVAETAPVEVVAEELEAVEEAPAAAKAAPARRGRRAKKSAE